ncbi:MAG: arsenic resistance N-acetyltransferase ArsN2 [Gammaproteobacteria bacterium]
MALHVAVVGCGTGGPAAALLLHRAGHRVNVFESVAAPGPVGAGILLQPTGLAVLGALGLYDKALSLGARIDDLQGRTARGRRIFDLRYRDLAPSCFGLGIHRGALFSLLFDALRRAGVALFTGVDIARIDAEGERRSRLIDGAGRAYGPFDLVIVAAGTQSRLRDATGLVRRDAPYPWGALWAIIPDPEDRYAGRLAQVYDGAHTMIGILPTGRLPDNARGPNLVSFFWSLPRSEHERWRAGDFNAWKREVLRLWPGIEPLVARLSNPAALTFATYSDVRMRRWATDRVVFIGDCAHAMSPQLGQGANLALVDALALAEALAAEAEVPTALARYCQLRRGHLGFYQAMSRFLTPLYQSHSRALGALRDWSFGPMARIPYLERQMLATLAGIKTGLFSAMPLNEPKRGLTMTIEPAKPGDLDAILALLRAADLPTGGVDQHLHGFVVARDDGALAGVAGAELYDGVGLLRSVAVAAPFRNRGVASKLCEAIHAKAAAQGVQALYLLTTTAQNYFGARGFEAVPRAVAPPAIQQCEEFRSLCPASAVLMRRNLA